MGHTRLSETRTMNYSFLIIIKPIVCHDLYLQVIMLVNPIIRYFSNSFGICNIRVYVVTLQIYNYDKIRITFLDGLFT